VRAGRDWARLVGLVSFSAVLVATVISWGTICLGRDGHVAFETSIAGRCTAQDGASSTSLADEEHLVVPWGLGTAPLCCGPCTDLVSASGQWLERVAASSQDPGAGSRAAAFLAAWTSHLRAIPARPSLANSAPPVPRAGSSRTLLRC
jgi:hypothetical protein